LPFELDADYNIARGVIEKIGVGKIVHRDKVPPFPDGLLCRRRPADAGRDRQ
jgi:hypothetical protein